jgi:hypothetical protein
VKLHLLHRSANLIEFDDPRGYIHAIQWGDLRPIDPNDLRQAGVNLDIPFFDNGLDARWVLWSPPHPGFVWNHHLFTEEEVYAYNVLKGWSFPDHNFENQVIFAARELDATDFIPDLFKYWENWVLTPQAFSL